ncbi:PAS domain-containing sensor histidine kinase [Sandaracinus amylolyticus]|uniref:PAS domain-containing sensor histidine kinase n=1 Tax=Sandaracinus amylolyticus TaxID=927083 RepID=UPI001F2A7015|nr:PAS domain-containing sensor histidine kinase [Sandaracinus amylolyticus]
MRFRLVTAGLVPDVGAGQMDDPHDFTTMQHPSPEALALVAGIEHYAIVVLDTEGHVLTWNQGARLMKGWDEAEIVGRSFTLFYTEEDQRAGKPHRLLAEAVALGRIEDEAWRVRKDGTRFWADVVITALRDERGALRGFVKVVRDLTERREAEQALRRSEDRLRLLVESVKDYAFFMLEPDGRIATWNPGAERIKGWTAREVIGRDLSIFYPADAVARGRPSELLRIATEEGRVEEEGWRVRKDGSRFWADVVISRVQDESGRLVGFSKVTRDLTARRAIDDALRASEERWRLLVASVKDYAIFMLDRDGRVATWNAGAEQLQGYRAAEVIGRHFDVFYGDDERAMGKPARELVIAEREGRHEDEGWRVRKDGSRFWANVVISAMRDANGALLGFTKVTRDQTEQRRATRRLEARARQQEAMAELGLAALRDRDPEAVAERVVRSIADVLGADRVALLVGDGEGMRVAAGLGWSEGTIGARLVLDGRTLAGHVAATREAAVVDDFEHASFVRSPLEQEHGVRSGVAVVVPALESSARPYGVIVALRTRPNAVDPEDVSFLRGVANVVAAAVARRADEEQLRAAELAAAEQRHEVRVRDEFISIAAHEMRTPLNALQLSVHALDRVLGADATAPVRKRMASALRQTRRLGLLVDRLLDTSRIVSGHLDVVPEPVDLAELAHEVVDTFQDAAQHAGSELTVVAEGDATGEWDRTLLTQVATNLVANAIQYGAGKPICVRTEGAGDRARLVVEDRGIGIGPDDLERIFDRFQRASPTRHVAGLGLGLYITREIACRHGGHVHVESRPGEGARFVVELPRARSRA